MTTHEITPRDPHVPRCEPGDVVIARGGDYEASIFIEGVGLPTQRILLMNAPGEVVTFRGSELYESKRRAALVLTRGAAFVDVAENPEGGELSMEHDDPEGTNGFIVQGKECRLINVRTHRVGNNSVDHAQRNSTLYGVSATRTGWDDTEEGQPDPKRRRGHGHSLYVQNEALRGQVLLRHCVTGYGFAHGLHVFGNSSKKVEDVHTDQCLFSNTSILSRHERVSSPVLIGGESGAVTSSCRVTRSLVYEGDPYRAPHTRGLAGFGDSAVGLRGTGFVELRNNRIVGRLNTGSVSHWTRNNRITHRHGTGVEEWQGNLYTRDVGENDHPYSNESEFYVHPNIYEPRRAYVGVLHWDGKPSLKVPLSNVCDLDDPHRRYDIWHFSEDGLRLLTSFTFTGGLVDFPRINGLCDLYMVRAAR